MLGRHLCDGAPESTPAPLAPSLSIDEPSVASWRAERLARPQVRGKFFHQGDAKLWVRGVTYGTFRPDTTGSQYGSPEAVDRDFGEMAAHGLNCVRTYTVPPRWLLDAAERHGLRVMIGIPWEHHVTFLDDRARAGSIERRVRAGVAACAGHPSVLCYAVGNEIPGPIVRWHGPLRVERYLEQLYRAAKAEDPATPVTYVNYPTTEYLDLSFLDVVAFNVYLESQDRLEAYLARLQNLAGDRPLLMGELGLDSRRHSESTQARVLDWQLRTAFAAGCAGVFVFAWTDEWHRGGFDVEDWEFGLIRRDRRPKPALTAVARALADVPVGRPHTWPRVSVVVCSYNGARTIRDTLEGLRRLEYPDFEVLVVDDGSTDATPQIAAEYEVRVISTPNRGLSAARNTGLAAASGEIVAFLDDDAWPDPHWLAYLAHTFSETTHAAVGGPNIAPAGDGLVAECVANAPGGPAHVLVGDREAEHIPGCNMAFRKSALQAIGGFDPRFRVAGDDVDVCWKLQARGWTIGFHPASLVWHHRRNSVLAYWRQQQGYGKAEALLEKKWPEKYNAAGHVGWAGRVYGPALAGVFGWRAARIYHGTWGSAPFQALYQPPPGKLADLLAMPEWYLVLGLLAGLVALGTWWSPLLVALPVLALGAGATVARALDRARRARFPGAVSPAMRWRRVALTALLHLVQPLARLSGRVRHGLTPWRRLAPRGFAPPWGWGTAIWRERWEAPHATLQALQQQLRAEGVENVRAGGAYDRWDLEVPGGALGSARLLLAVEEHGAGRQLVRLRAWPHTPITWHLAARVLLLLAVASAAMGPAAVAAVFASATLMIAARMALDTGAAMAAVRRAVTPAATTVALPAVARPADPSVERAA